MIYDGFAWDIKGIGELGYRRELELFCQTDLDHVEGGVARAARSAPPPPRSAPAPSPTEDEGPPQSTFH